MNKGSTGKIVGFSFGFIIGLSPVVAIRLDQLTSNSWALTAKLYFMLHAFGLLGYLATEFAVFFAAGATCALFMVNDLSFSQVMLTGLLSSIAGQILLSGWVVLNNPLAPLVTASVASGCSGVGGIVVWLTRRLK